MEKGARGHMLFDRSGLLRLISQQQGSRPSPRHFLPKKAALRST